MTPLLRAGLLIVCASINTILVTLAVASVLDTLPAPIPFPLNLLLVSVCTGGVLVITDVMRLIWSEM